MNAPPPPVSPASIGLALSGGLLLVIATALAARPRAVAHSFAWIVVAGTAYSLLALAAALYTPESDGLRAAAMQLMAVLLAAALGGLCPADADEQGSPRGSLPAAARGFAWLTLVGLPPTTGFHGKILIYRTLVAAGWEWLAVLAMVCSAAALAPALWAISARPPARAGGTRAIAMIVLIAVIVVVGLYPAAGLAVATLIGGLAQKI